MNIFLYSNMLFKIKRGKNMEKKSSHQCVATIIVLLFIGTSFVSVSARYIPDNQNDSIIPNKQNNGLNDIFFDMKMSILMQLAKLPSVSACIINTDQIV